MKGSKIRKANRCPFCGKGRIVADPYTLENICNRCGSVVSVRRETLRPEWREFELARGKKRVGPPITLTKADMGLATYIGRTYPQRLKHTAAERRRIQRIRKLQRRMAYYGGRQRGLAKAVGLLSRLADRMHLPRPVREDASYIYRKAMEKKLIRGRTISAMVSTALYAACRNLGVHRTLDDISRTSGVRKERIARNYRLLLERLDLKTRPPDPAKALSRIATRLSVGERTKRRALEILRKAQEAGMATGKKPRALAAAALYAACITAGQKRTQRSVAKAAGISDVTLRIRSQEMMKLLRLTKTIKKRTVQGKKYKIQSPNSQ